MRSSSVGGLATLKQIIGISLTGAFALALVATYLVTLAASAKQQAGSACLALQVEPVGKPAPAFDLPDLGGAQHSLAAARGKLVMLHFWATWCPPCVEELPSIVRLQQALADTDFELVTVSVDDTPEQVQTFLARHSAVIGGLPVLMDPAKAVPTSYGTEKFPETYLIDRDGTIQYRVVNKRDWSSPAAQACIRSLL